MGLAAAVTGIAGAALSIGSSMHSARKQEKAQERAEAAAREAAKRNVTVQSSGAEPVRKSVENEPAGEIAAQRARKRRQGYAGTLTGRTLTTSLVGNQSTLGGS